MSNPLKRNYLKAWVVGMWAVGLVGACGGHGRAATSLEPSAPFPATTMAGRDIGVMAFTLVLADDSLHWEAALADRPKVLGTADSLFFSYLSSRIPEVGWKAPARLWRGARGANDLPDDPHQLGVALLRQLPVGAFVPDPLRAQLRMLGAVAGGSYVLAPASLLFKVDSTHKAGEARTGTAELTLVLVDVRLGQVSWRSVARGEGADPWSALNKALKTLTPGMP